MAWFFDERVEGLPRCLSGRAAGFCLLLSDVLALVLSFFCGGTLAWALRSLIAQQRLGDFLSDVTSEQVVLFFILGVLSLLWLDTKAHYRQRLPYWEVFGHIVRLFLVGFLIGGFIQFAAKNIYSRLWFGCSWGLFALFLYLGRILTRRLLLRAGGWTIRAVMVGSGPSAQAALGALAREKRMGYEIVRVVPVRQLQGLEGAGAWHAFLAENEACFLFLAIEGSEMEVFARQIKALSRERVPFALVPPWQGLPLSSLSTHHFPMQDVMLMHDSNRLALPLPRVIKGGMDFLASLGALLFFSPLFAALAALIARDGGSVFFKQNRIGQGGRTFACYKFRTMRPDAQKVLDAYLEANPDKMQEWQDFQKLKDDPRVTRLGAVLRRWSLDELPQLINVLKGDMSLVGPRPCMPGQTVYYKDDLALYESVRPGLTGPWQVEGRNSLTFSERVALESWYTRNWTFWLDVVIILKTFPVLFKGERMKDEEQEA